jgi:16S rRNA A1518/A1519 N6-dimethyltransferase RsmA/KsgA/DIM1 with predicted DNA glycosylase/AP lyase activity
LQVKKAFSERRKMLRNTLQPLYTAQQVNTWCHLHVAEKALMAQVCAVHHPACTTSLCADQLGA